MDRVGKHLTLLPRGPGKNWTLQNCTKKNAKCDKEQNYNRTAYVQSQQFTQALIIYKINARHAQDIFHVYCNAVVGIYTKVKVEPWTILCVSYNVHWIDPEADSVREST